MKSNPLAGFLVVVLIACALWTAWIASVYTYSAKKSLYYGRQVDYLENLRLTVQSLATEAVAYSQQHPSIDPVLQKFEIKQRSTNSPLSAPPPAPPQPKK
jgi:hypothetical protein